jgi:rRNA maturation endonuclease Nob1
MTSVLTAPLSSLPQLEYLILDANAIIHGFGTDFHKKAKHIVTIPEVIDEIKDEHARELLGRLPYTIEFREPSVESCRAVAQFALKSGDYNALSKPDIRLIALTHMLQNQQHISSDSNSATEDPLSQSKNAASATDETILKPAVLPSPAEFKKSNWSRALFAHKLGASSSTATTASSASAAAVEEEAEEDKARAANHLKMDMADEESAPAFDEDDFPVLGSGPDSYYEEDYDEGMNMDIDLEALRELEEEQLREEAAMQYDVVVVEEEDEDDQDGHMHEEHDADIDEETMRLREQEREEEMLQSADQGNDHSHSEHLHDADCPCREVTAEEMAEFDAHATQVPAKTTSASDPSEANEPGKKQKKMRHKKLRKLQGQGEEGAQAPSQIHPPKAVAEKQSSSNTSAIASSRRVPQSKDEAEDDGVGWISSTNIEKAQRITRWKLPKSEFQQPSSVSVTSGEKQSEATDAEQDGSATEEADKESIDAVQESEVAPASVSSTRKRVEVSWDGVSVVCCTSDYSMQNVLVQMGLRVISPTGQCIRAVRRYVMYCNACYRIHRKESDLTRMFCAFCGANHLSRVNCTMLENGEVQLHLKRNYTLSQKGTKYSLPAPGAQPRFQGELLLREDQLLGGIWKQRTLRVKKEVASAFGEEVAGELGVHVNKGAKIVFGLGKKNNPNAMKGRERRGKRRTNNQVK